MVRKRESTTVAVEIKVLDFDVQLIYTVWLKNARPMPDF
jgi:hypothetical protein